ncbi:hypothetical protein TNCV_798041 [Trichonephila clavipes]|nr:hypothetical protein TNCV_798041 [Trichonephila clavipes]
MTLIRRSLSKILQKDLVGMNPMCMIFGSSGLKKALPHENYDPTTNWSLLTEGGKFYGPPRILPPLGWGQGNPSSLGPLLAAARSASASVSSTYNREHNSKADARPHTAVALQSVEMLPWPERSSDLSPIEHVRDIIELQHHSQRSLTVPVETQQEQKDW